MYTGKRDRLRRAEWRVAPAPFHDGKRMVEEFHYSRGGSNTFVYMHGLYRNDDNWLAGVAWWLPPTRVACESVNKENWQKVLSLTRLVIHPDAPANACSFLLSRSVALIWDGGRFDSLVTYADEAMQHTGSIYRAANWQYAGRTGPYPRWEDKAGRQVAPKATVNRTKAQMEALGHKRVGSYHKHKFVLHKPLTH